MKIAVAIVIILSVLILLIIWAACVVSRRADDDAQHDLDCYLATQQEEARIHGCATRTTAAKD